MKNTENYRQPKILKKLLSRCSILAVALLTIGNLSATTYYWNGGTVTSVSSWGTNLDGSGANPSSFTVTGNTFFIQSGQSPDFGGWTVGGSSGTHTTSVNVLVGASPFASVAFSNVYKVSISSASDFTYGSGTAPTNLRALTYGNLIWESATAGTPGNDVVTTGDFTINTVAELRMLAGSGATAHTWGVGGNVSISSGSSLVFSSSASTSTGAAILNIGGGLSNSGTISRGTGGSSAAINFNGTGSSNAAWGTNSGNFNVTVTTGKTITFTSALSNGTGTVGVTGTLNLGAAGSITGTGGITSSGTLVLGASDKIANAAPLSLGGGKFDTAGFSETLNTLTLTSSSILDLGSGASILHFAASNTIFWTGTLSIYNWTGLAAGGGTDQVFFGAAAGALTETQLADIRFYSDSGITLLGTGKILSTGEITALAIPEPSGLALAGLGAAFLLSRCQRRAGV